MRTSTAGLLALAATATACIPLYPTVREANKGTVLDGDAGRPVSGATVRVESFRVPTPPGGGWGVRLVRSIEVRTDGNGRWSVPSEHEWTIGILAADGLPLFADVYCVSAEGFQKAAWTAHKGWLPRSSSVDESLGDEKTSNVRLVRTVDRPALPGDKGSMTTCGVAVENGDAVQQAVAADGASRRR
jgi:hypothetical protein